MIKTLKKFSKKSLAILIALLMIISVMPFTPTISVEAADVSSIQNLTFDKVTATGKGYHYTDVATGGYDNILYCSQTPLISNDKYSEVRNLRCKTFSPTVVVGLYDGTTTGFPVVLETKSYKWLTTTNEFALRYISWNGDSRLTLKRSWYGYHKSAYQTWPTESSTKIPVTSTKDTSMSQKDTTSRFFNNEIYYIGSGNADTYYDEITGTKYYIDVNGHGGSDSCSGTKMIVLDYNRFYTVVDKVKEIQKNLVEYPNRYTDTSTTNAINAIKAYYDANQRVKNDFSSVNDTNAASIAKSVATDMKNAVAAINAVNLVCAHSKTRVEGAQAATCVTAGKSGNVYCDYCDTLMESSYDIPATGHNYTSKVTKAATCSEKGVRTYTCQNDGNHTYTEDIAIDPNNHTGLTSIPAVEATCTKTGLTAGQKCTDCEVITVAQQETAKKPHTWGDWVYDDNKQEKRSCTVCDTVDSEKRNCVYEEKSVTPATCSAVGKRVYRCTQCGNEYEEILPIDSEAHNIATKVETTNATCTVAGKKETVTYCTLCNEEISREKTEDIPALGHDYTYTSIDSVSHSVICSRNCNEEGWSYTEKHNIKNGECTKCDYVSKVTITFVNENGTEINSTEYTIGATVAIPDLPETEKNDNGDGTHTVVTYAWDDEPQTTAQTEATYTVTSSSNKVACSFELTEQDIKDGDKTKDKFTCSVCSGVMYKEVADKTALNAAIVALQNDLDLPEAGYKYDAARVEAAKKLIAQANAIDRYAEQKDVDAMTSELGTAKTTLNAKENLAKYNLNFKILNYSENNAVIAEYTSEFENRAYGTTVDFDKYVIPTINDDTSLSGLPQYAVYKWVKIVDDKEQKLNTTDIKISDVVKSDATYICYLMNFKATDDTKKETRVRYLDKSGHTIDFDTAIVGERYQINESIVAPKLPYYVFDKWEPVFGTPDEVGTREIVYQATYRYDDTALANKCKIQGLGGVMVNGSETCEATYDSKVVLTGATKYAFCDSTGKIISYINNDYIFTPHINNETVYITAVVDEVTQATTAITGNFVQKDAGILNDGRTYHNLYVNAQFYLPEGATAVEAGLVLSKSVSEENELQIGKENVTKLVSNSQGTNHEYSMAMSFTKDGTVHARSYLIYVDKSGTTHTVYSAVKTIDYKA